MTGRSKFLAIYVVIAFVTKVIGEIVHEVAGHGLFILLFGGQITSVHISLLWPYELSHIGWSGSFMRWQHSWIAGGGILVSIIVSGALQALLLFNVIKDWRSSTPLLWLAFWTFLNPTGYLIIGGVRPFGDVASLIAAGVLTQELSLLVGLILFVASFLSLSKLLITQLSITNVIESVDGLRLSLALFWAIIPVITMVTCLGMRLQILYFQVFSVLSLVPPLLAMLVPNFLRSNNILAS
ncbi:MAG: hypothetical protein Q6364_12755 [Candidatus Hermodarchaeota archaeon]|nr:hypothetical protein [Candidatus Hermodarchaeota archaeon]